MNTKTKNYIFWIISSKGTDDATIKAIPEDSCTDDNLEDLVEEWASDHGAWHVSENSARAGWYPYSARAGWYPLPVSPKDDFIGWIMFMPNEPPKGYHLMLVYTSGGEFKFAKWRTKYPWETDGYDRWVDRHGNKEITDVEFYRPIDRS